MNQDRTSIGLQAETKRQFDRVKPGGLSANEFLSLLLEHWEGTS
jgi:hypothetical protein